MKNFLQFIFIFLITLLPITISVNYNRTAAKEYAEKHWSTPNHNCSSVYSACTPYSYLGGEACGYEAHGGDSGNFVSQCIIAGGYPKLTAQGECAHAWCLKEIAEPTLLGRCLANVHGWKKTCSLLQNNPPADIQIGDVLIFHKGSCTDYSSLAAIVTSTSSGIKIATHSWKAYNRDIKAYIGTYRYVEYVQKK